MRIGLVSAVMMVALSAPPVQAACTSSRLRTSDEGLAEFVARPQGLLDRYPQGTSLLRVEVRNIAAASRVAHRPLATVIQAANRSQSEAIGAGLASASTLCQSSDGVMAVEIRKLAMESGNSVVATTFVEESGDAKKPALPRSGVGGTEAASGGGHTLSLRVQPGPLADPFAPIPIRRP